MVSGAAPVNDTPSGKRRGEDLEVVLVIGLSADAVEQTALRVAARELGT